jgi:4-amino-4-deoxy-L-arabinose transferase-like glycosyltransferase
MEDQETDFKQQDSFRDFLRAHQRWVLLVLLFAFIIRVAFLLYWPPRPDMGDASARYIPTAINLINGNGFSIDERPPYRSSVATMPVYPVFVAAVYAVFGPNPYVVSLIQIVLDLVTCLMVAFISFQLAPPRLKRSAAFFSLITYGFLSWFTLIFSAWLLTETIAMFLTLLTVVCGIIAYNDAKKSSKYWTAAGLACGIAILTRPDSVLLAAATGLFLVFLFIRRRSGLVIMNILCFSLAVGLTLLPWIIRNYRAYGKFEPLASEWGFVEPNGYMPRGYLLWIKTWIVDETHFYKVFNQAFFPGTVPFVLDGLPDEFFDSEEERRQVIGLMTRYNETLYFTPELEAEFRRIAEIRINRDPFRFYILLPVKRIASLWLTGFATTKPNTNYKIVLRALSVLPIIIGGLIGFLKWCRPWEITMLLLLIIISRTLFMAYHYAPETRYIVEAYPLMIAAAAVAFAFAWSACLNAGFFRNRRDSLW